MYDHPTFQVSLLVALENEVLSMRYLLHSRQYP